MGTPGDWISLRSDLVRAGLEIPEAAQPVWRHLTTTPFSRGCVVRSPTTDVPFSLAVAFMPFRWDEHAPWLWLATTIGLSSVRQAAMRTSFATPERFELCVAFREPEGEHEWAVLRAAWEAGTLGDIRSVPALLARFHSIGLDVASWLLIEKASFSFWDHILNASLIDQFPPGLLTPPIVEFLVNGITPLTGDGSSVRVEPGDWMDTNLLRRSGDCMFFQLTPLMADEYVEVSTNGSEPFFAWGLLAQDSELEAGLDSSAFITNLRRESRIGTFRKAT